MPTEHAPPDLDRRMKGRWCQLRPVLPSDSVWLYMLMESAKEAYRFRFRDAQPSFEAVAARDPSVYAHYIVMNAANGESLGYVVAHNADIRSGVATISAISHPDVRGDFRAVEGIRLFVDDLFQRLEFRKLYAEVFEFNRLVLQSLKRLGFQSEGVLVDHLRYGGRYWSLHLLALYADAWRRWSFDSTGRRST